MSKGRDKSKLVYALDLMTKRGNRHQTKRYIPNSRIYSIVKKEFSIVNSEFMTKNNPMFNPDVVLKHKLAIIKRGATKGMSGKKHNEETKKLMRKNHKSGIHKLEVRKKISESIKKIHQDPNYVNPMFDPDVIARHKLKVKRGRCHSMYGKKHSEETKMKMSISRKKYYENRRKENLWK